jgi:hypothetical protein
VSDDVSDAFPETDDMQAPDEPTDERANERAGRPDDGPDLSAAAPSRPVERTGNPVVDSVLDSLRELDAMPVSEHVAVFEAAHDRLRGALADAGEPPADS